MFLRDTLERAAKTFLQAFLATIAVTFAIPADVGDATAWKRAALAALVAAASAGLSAVSSLMSKNGGTPGTASLVKVPPAEPLCASDTGTPNA